MSEESKQIREAIEDCRKMPIYGGSETALRVVLVILDAMNRRMNGIEAKLDQAEYRARLTSPAASPMVSNLTECMKRQFVKWLKPVDITASPQCWSTPGQIVMLLLVVPTLGNHIHIVMGWHFAGRVNQWREAGSPSEAYPLYWMPLPQLPV